MKSIEANLESLFDDIRRSGKDSSKSAPDFLKRFPFIPPSIPLENGLVLWLSEAGANCITEIAKTIRNNSQLLRAAVSEVDMRRVTNDALGRLLVPNPKPNTTFELPTNLTEFREKLNSEIEKAFKKTNLKRTHIFGARLFDNQKESIKIGPVRFTERNLWLQNLLKQKIITDDESDRILKSWKSQTSERAKNDKIIGPNEIIEAIGPCSWVCEIDVYGHSINRSREKALLAARIAFSCIALNWDTPSIFLKTTGLYFDTGNRRLRTTIVRSKDRFVAGSMSSVDVRNYFLKDFADFKKIAGGRLKVVGKAIRTFVSVRPTTKHPRLEARICQALIWFNEACKEELPFLAVVKYAAVMDVLANGGKAHGIGQVIENRLFLKSLDTPFLKNGTTARKLIEQIYSAGRSKIVHGTRLGAIDDLDEMRAQAELLATFMLRACIHWLSRYKGPDRDDCFKTG